MRDISYLSYLLIVIVVVVYIAISTHLNRVLRRSHPEVWLAQGSPTFWNNSPANGIRFFRYFIAGSSFKELRDSRLNLYVTIMRVLFGLVVVWFVGTIVIDLSGIR